MRKSILILLLVLAFGCEQSTPQRDTVAAEAVMTDTVTTSGTTAATSSAELLTIPTSTVFVTFTGLETFAKMSDKHIRVAMVQGETGKEHTPMLTPAR